MADATRGKAILDGLLDYPLPVVAATADYLFYFVPDGDAYGKKSRQFFAKWNPNHRVRQVKSLEELIGSLHADVTQHGVRKIREIVIVSHGTSMGLQLPLLASRQIRT